MWPAPGGFRVLSLVRMYSAVVEGLVVVVVSQVWVGVSRGRIGSPVGATCLSCVL